MYINPFILYASVYIDKGSFLELTSFRQLVFTWVLVLISSLRRQSSVCRSQNKPRKFRRPGSQYDRAVVGWALAEHPGSFSATSESSTASGCSPLRIGVDSQERCMASMLLVRPCYEPIIAARQGHVRLWTNFTHVDWFRRDQDNHWQVKNFWFLKMTPGLNTGEQHEQI